MLEDPVIDTPYHQIDHLSQFTLTFFLGSQRQQQLRLNLQPNHDILPEDAHISYLDVQGNVRSSERIERHAHKVFKGSAWLREEGGKWDEVGWARVYVKKDGPKPLLEGAFSVDGDHHHIQLRSSYLQARRETDLNVRDIGEDHMIVYRDSNSNEESSGLEQRSPATSCGADNLDFNYEFSNPLSSRSGESIINWGTSLIKRQSGRIGAGNLRATIGSTAGCPTEGRVALIGIATDCTYSASFASTDAIRANLITVVNTASSLYERTFNITIGLRNLTISDAQCPATTPEATPWNIPCSGADIEGRLNLFSTWRGARGDNNAYWTLMSTCNTGSAVGLAWLGQLCVSGSVVASSQTVSGANVVVRTPGEWQVFA